MASSNRQAPAILALKRGDVSPIRSIISVCAQDPFSLLSRVAHGELSWPIGIRQAISLHGSLGPATPCERVNPGSASSRDCLQTEELFIKTAVGSSLG